MPESGEAMRVWYVLAHYDDGLPAEAKAIEAESKAHALAWAHTLYPRATRYEVSDKPDGRRDYDE